MDICAKKMRVLTVNNQPFFSNFVSSHNTLLTNEFGEEGRSVTRGDLVELILDWTGLLKDDPHGYVIEAIAVVSKIMHDEARCSNPFEVPLAKMDESSKMKILSQVNSEYDLDFSEVCAICIESARKTCAQQWEDEQPLINIEFN